jgi:hypothetical protein
MLVYRFWRRKRYYPKGVPNAGYSYRHRERHWEGWFLFGILPLYIRMTKSEVS